MSLMEKEVEKKDVSRRRLIKNWLWGVFAAIAGSEIIWLSGSLLKSHKKKNLQNNSEKIIDAGQVAEFKPGEIKAVPQGQFYLSCQEDGSFIALSRTCTHLGCSVPWKEEQNKFICPCHGSTFDKKGVVLTAPAMRPLDYYPLRIENGRIRVDISTPVKRQKFEDSQLVKI